MAIRGAGQTIILFTASHRGAAGYPYFGRQFLQGSSVWEMATAWRVRPFTMDQEPRELLQEFTQFTLRLGLIRRLTSLIRKLDRVGNRPVPIPTFTVAIMRAPTFLASTVIMLPPIQETISGLSYFEISKGSPLCFS